MNKWNEVTIYEKYCDNIWGMSPFPPVPKDREKRRNKIIYLYLQKWGVQWLLKGNLKASYLDCEEKDPLNTTSHPNKNFKKGDSLYVWGSSSRDFKIQ